MASVEAFPANNDNKMSKNFRYTKYIILILGIGAILGSIILALSIATLAKANKKSDEIIYNDQRPTINSKALQPSSDATLAASIRIEEVMSHLNQLQRIATASNGTRAINTPGFNQTLDYIINYLTANTNYKVTKALFFVKNFGFASNPILVSSINDVTKNYAYSSDLSTAEFYYVKYSTSANFSDFVELTAIPNVGCSDDDWQKADPPPKGRVALVKRGICLFRDKAALVAKYNVAALLLILQRSQPDQSTPTTKKSQLKIEVNISENSPTVKSQRPVDRRLNNDINRQQNQQQSVSNLTNNNFANVQNSHAFSYVGSRSWTQFRLNNSEVFHCLRE